MSRPFWSLAVVSGLLALSAKAAPLDPNAYTSLGTLNVGSGTLTINTDTLAISGAASFTGVVQSQGPGLPEIAVFTFDSIDVAAGVSLTLTGSRPAALLSHSDAAIAAALVIRGANGGGGNSQAAGAGGAGGVGGGAGGSASPVVGPIQPGFGPGGGLAGGGGGFGGAGGAPGPATDATSGPAYGDLSVALQGGSGGGAGIGVSVGTRNGPGGGGAGGALEIGAVGVLTLISVDARGANGGGTSGGQTSSAAYVGAGGGSGGGLFLHGATVGVSEALQAGGGAGTLSQSQSTRAGGGGGGGRVRIETGATYVLGAGVPSVDVGGGPSPTNSSSGPGNPPIPGSPGRVGLAELAPALTVIPAGLARAMNADGTISESVASAGGSAWTLRTSNLEIDAGAVVFSSVPVAMSHDLMLDGGLAALSQGLVLTGTSALSGFGQLAGALSGGATSSIEASGGTLTVGDANHSAGFDFAGTASASPGAALLLLDADRATLGSVTTLGAGSALQAPNGALLGPGASLAASGAASVAGAFLNQGLVAGPGAVGQFLAFLDDVSGAGSYSGNILFSDGFSPGSSPAAVFLENAMFDASASLAMELGGLAPGSGYDRLVLSGLLDLGGTLDVLLIDGFAPALGDEFDLFDFGSLVGTFGAVILPGLGEGLAWDASSLYTDGTLAVTAIPEPSAAVLLGLGVGALAVAGRARSW